MIRWLFTDLLGTWLSLSLVLAADPPAPVPLNAAARAELVQEITDLRAMAKRLDSGGTEALHLVDAEFGIDAVDRSLRFDELTKKNSASQALAILARAKRRIEALEAGGPNWGQTSGRTVLGYRSRVDDTVQPYALTLPEGYQEAGTSRLPLFIELHG